jgi:hypothetical protein
MKSLDPLGKFLKPPYGKPLSTLGKGLIFSELARIDAGACTFLAV